MRHFHKPEGNDKKSDRKSLRSKEPLVERPRRFRRFLQKAALVVGMAVVPAIVVAISAATLRCRFDPSGTEWIVDGGVRDGGVDAGDHPDVGIPDARPDVGIPDARPDVGVADSAVDSAVEDSGVDSAVPDAEVDGSTPTCPVGTNQMIPGWFRPINSPGTIGTEYEVTYTGTVDATNITIDVDCVSTANPIVTAYQLTLNQEAIIPLGGKNFRVTVTQFNAANSWMDAAIEDP